ncbi:MAG: hypothetical protein Q3995_02120 [Eubacteriales bacterium]|nr:hypothetical protein [Eubacteriales bacterium]
MEQCEECFRPEVPKRAKQGREQGEVNHGSEQRTEKHIDSQLPSADAQREKEAKHGEDDAIDSIEDFSKQVQSPSAHTNGTQQVVKKGGSNAQQQRVEQ